jgi:hypothetical protein
MFDKFMEKAVKASFWMIGAFVAWLGFAGWIAVADRANLALHEHLCEAPKRVIIVWSHDDKGNLLRRRECKLPSGEIIRFVQDANGRPVRAR